jgi:protein SCO1/2
MLAALLLLGSAAPWAHGSSENTRLPVAGPAPEFSLTDQNGAPVTLTGLRGKVVVVTFIYTRCNQACPLVTEKMASLQAELGPDFDSRVHFVSISVDPEIDTPAVLRVYAKTHGANMAGWSFLTGPPPMVEEVERAYCALGKQPARRGGVEHLFVTSLIDRQGYLRVRYLGGGLKREELLRDLQVLLGE